MTLSYIGSADSHIIEPPDGTQPSIPRDEMSAIRRLQLTGTVQHLERLGIKKATSLRE
jgi:hypothetical protein